MSHFDRAEGGLDSQICCHSDGPISYGVVDRQHHRIIHVRERFEPSLVCGEFLEWPIRQVCPIQTGRFLTVRFMEFAPMPMGTDRFDGTVLTSDRLARGVGGRSPIRNLKPDQLTVLICRGLQCQIPNLKFQSQISNHFLPVDPWTVRPSPRFAPDSERTMPIAENRPFWYSSAHE